MTYCTATDVRNAAEAGSLDAVTDEAVLEAVAEAGVWVERFTGRHFGIVEGALVLRSDSLGRIHLPVDPTGRDAAAVFSVALREAPLDPLPAGSWMWLPAVQGEESVIVVRAAHLGTNMLVVGREPWARRRHTACNEPREYVVTGSFGEPGIPAGVRTATAMLAAWMLGAPLAVDSGPTPGAPDLTNVKAFTEEGHSVTFGTVQAPPQGVEVTTTGLPQVDRLLAPHARRQRRWSIA